MPKRSETPAEREARDRVKHRYGVQLAAINDFFTRERRIEGLRADIATLETEQGAAAAKLAEATSVGQAAEIIGWPQSRVREVASRWCTSARGAKASSTTASAQTVDEGPRQGPCSGLSQPHSLDGIGWAGPPPNAEQYGAPIPARNAGSRAGLTQSMLREHHRHKGRDVACLWTRGAPLRGPLSGASRRHIGIPM